MNLNILNCFTILEPENMVLLGDKVNQLEPVNLQKTPEMELTGVN